MAISQSARKDEGLSRVEGLGESARNDVSVHISSQRISPNKSVWARQPDSPLQFIHSCQHSRRMRKAREYRTTSLLTDSLRFCKRTRMPFSACAGFGLLFGEDHASAHKQFLEMKRMLVALTRKVGSERGSK